MCHLILECWKNTLQKKQYCSVHSFIVRFEFFFGVFLSLGISPHSMVPEKMKTPLLGNDDLCMRLGQASCSQATLLGRPALTHQPLRSRVSRDPYCNSVHLHTIFNKKWMKVIFLKIDNDSGSKNSPIEVEVDGRVMHQGCLFHV